MELANLEAGSKVWVSDPVEVWLSGRVVRCGAGEVVVQLDGPEAKEISVPFGTQAATPVRPRISSGNVRSVLKQAEELTTTEGALSTDDLSRLSELHDAALLQALQLRFAAGTVYTFTGPVLLAVNPFRYIHDLYSEEKLASFLFQNSSGARDVSIDWELPKGSLTLSLSLFQNLQANGDEEPGEYRDAEPPHIFGVARAAYAGIWDREASQSVLVAGESGAGKTETTKFVIRYLTLAAAAGDAGVRGTLEQRALDSNPLLEAFGNARTLRNDNSSRFGKYFQMHFDTEHPGAPSRLQSPRRSSAPDTDTALQSPRKGPDPSCSSTSLPPPRLDGAQIHTYLLEKVRIHGHQQGERSYHVFYQALAAAAAAVESDIDLTAFAGNEPEDFRYLRPSSPVKHRPEDVNGMSVNAKEVNDFKSTLRSMRMVGFENDEISGIFRALGAVLHLGNVLFQQPKTNSEGSEIDQEGSSRALAVVSPLLGVSESDLEVALCSKTLQTTDGPIKVALTVEKAADSRDALSRHLYGALFTHVVARANVALKGSQRGQLFIGVLDIFGFEFFQLNSLEQLCINFTNELLQQYFNQFIFQQEANLYEREGIEWDPLDFPDNKSIVELLNEPCRGVFPAIDDECGIVGGTEAALVRKLQSRFDTNPLFQLVPTRPEAFVVRHYAGPVEYTSLGFLEKNKDALGPDLMQCLKSSKAELVRSCFTAQHDRTFGTQASTSGDGPTRVRRARAYSVSSEFREQLAGLMARIHSTKPHFVRCIKPNAEQKPHLFNRQSVAEQLRYQGVLQTIEVSRAGYPERPRHAKALHEYRCLTPKSQRRPLAALSQRGDYASASRRLFEALREGPLRDVPAAACQIGKTYVFLRRDAVEALGAAYREVRSKAATQLQAKYRCVTERRVFLRLKALAILAQCLERRRAARVVCRARQVECAAVALQAAMRQILARAVMRERRKVATRVKAWYLGRRQRRCYMRALALLRRLQWWWRGIAQRRRWLRTRRSIVYVQSAWRRHVCGREVCGRRAALERKRRVARRLLFRWQSRKLESLRQRGAPCDRGWLDRLNPPARGPEISGALAMSKRRKMKLQYELEMLRSHLLNLNGREEELNRTIGMQRKIVHAICIGLPVCIGVFIMRTRKLFT